MIITLMISYALAMDCNKNWLDHREKAEKTIKDDRGKLQGESHQAALPPPPPPPIID